MSVVPAGGLLFHKRYSSSAQNSRIPAKLMEKMKMLHRFEEKNDDGADHDYAF